MASDSIRVLIVGSSPTSYERPLYEQVARHPGVDFHACYCEGKRWDMIATEIPYRATILKGIKFPPGQAYWHYHMNPSILSVLWRERPDVVVLGGYYLLAAQLAIIWCWLTRTPYIICCESHRISARKRWIHWLKELYVRPIVKRAAAYISLGKASREYLVSYGAPADAVFTVPNLSDVFRFHTEAENHKQQNKKTDGKGVQFLYVGRLIEVKGLEYLLRAFGKLQQHYPQVALSIVGVGPLEQELKSLANELALEHLEFAGGLPHQKLPEVYASASVFVLPSVFEPYGAVVTEAMACELPLILSRQVGAAPDMLEEGRNGLLVCEQDVDDLCRAMEWMVEHTGERQAMGRHSWEIVRQWDNERLVAEFMGAIWKALGKKSGNIHKPQTYWEKA